MRPEIGTRQEQAVTFYCHPQGLVETTDIGPSTRIWAFAHVMAGARIGAECNIGDHAYIESGVTLGNNVTVKNGVSLWNGLTVEDDVFLGPNCVFTNDRNPRAFIKKSEEKLLQTRIKKGATIGANATVLCGITIGAYAFVGAGAVVLLHVPDFGLVVGNPARHIGWMCECAHKLSLAALASGHTSCRCLHCGRCYVRTSKGLEFA
jgi:UDP-2-acetamido-3-amino-2,3-dideoxy-glucuronate N-acetyltransferase